MANAPISIHPNAQPDVPREAGSPAGPRVDTPTDHSEAGPVHGPLARAVNDLRNAASAIGPVNFLPDTWPVDDIATLDAATALLHRLLPTDKP